MADAAVSNTAGLNTRAGSSPAFGTNTGCVPKASVVRQRVANGGQRITLPSGVTVAHGSLEPLVGVRIPARQPRQNQDRFKLPAHWRSRWALIARFETKIQATLARVWGEEKEEG